MAGSFPQQWADHREDSETERVRRWRVQAARHAGLTHVEADRFADGDGNTARLRDAYEHGATHEQLLDIFL